MNSVVTQRFIKCHDKLKEDKHVRSSRQFALSLDYLPQSLSEILKGRRDVTIELVRKAVETYRINPVYLYTGEGPMFMSDDWGGQFRILTVVTDNRQEERIVHVPIPAQAGYAGEMSDPGFVEELPTYTLPDYKYRSGTHRSFDVAGDSMEPTLYEGDKVVCNFLEPAYWESSIKSNYVYVVVTRSDVVVKRVKNLLKDKKELELISDNSFYHTYKVSLADIREIWYIRAKISPFLPSPQNVQRYLLEEIQALKQTIFQQNQLIRGLSEVIEKKWQVEMEDPYLTQKHEEISDKG